MPDTFYERKARSTGLPIVTEDTEREGGPEFAVDGYRFVAACRTHGTVVGIEAEKWGQAYAKSSDPREWCAECAALPPREAKPKAAAAPQQPTGSVANWTAEEREQSRQATDAAREAEEAAARKQKVADLKAEMKGMPKRLREANRAYEKALSAANRAGDRLTKTERDALWDEADRKQRDLINLSGRERAIATFLQENA